jgi:hypothetical protein
VSKGKNDLASRDADKGGGAMQWITTDDIRGETWARLLDFANTELCFERIAAVHGVASNNSLKQNYKKQAQQIRVSLLQAREYFRAADIATVVTRPNLLYYGMVSLASAVMLLRGSGDYSLDQLRKNPINKHHGLDFSTGINAKDAGQGTSLLEHSYAEVLPKGFFLNWYGKTPAGENVYAKVARQHLDGTESTNYEIHGIERCLRGADLAGRKFSLADLIADLPDLMQYTRAAGIAVPSSRVDYELSIEERTSQMTIEWRIHSASPGHLKQILEAFRFQGEGGSYFTVVPEEPQTHCVVRVAATAQQLATSQYSFPATRLSLNADQFIYGKPNFALTEYAQQYIFMYALSMFARYLPDLWIRCIDSHCKAARVIERSIAEIEKKFPIQVLSLLVNDDVFITAHRPSWY